MIVSIYSRLNDTQEEHSEEEEEEEEHEDGTFKLCFVLVCSFVLLREKKKERERESDFDFGNALFLSKKGLR